MTSPHPTLDGMPDPVVPPAPETLNLRDTVALSRTLVRKTVRRPATGSHAGPGRTEPWKVWEPDPLNRYRFPARYLRPDGRLEGVLVGLRTLYNGPVEWGSYDEPTVFYARETIHAALVSWHLRRTPVLVLLDDLEVIR